MKVQALRLIIIGLVLLFLTSLQTFGQEAADEKPSLVPPEANKTTATEQTPEQVRADDATRVHIASDILTNPKYAPALKVKAAKAALFEPWGHRVLGILSPITEAKTEDGELNVVRLSETKAIVLSSRNDIIAINTDTYTWVATAAIKALNQLEYFVNNEEDLSDNELAVIQYSLFALSAVFGARIRDGAELSDKFQESKEKRKLYGKKLVQIAKKAKIGFNTPIITERLGFDLEDIED